MSEDEQWWHRAACRGQPLALFYPEKGTTTRKAKQICLGCPVTTECLNDALTAEAPHDRHGVWGGMSKYDRSVAYDGKKPNPPREYCTKGHEFTADNVLHIGGRGKRRCKKCHEDNHRYFHHERTACKYGHELTGGNKVIRRGRTQCLKCEQDRSRKHRRLTELAV